MARARVQGVAEARSWVRAGTWCFIATVSHAHRYACVRCSTPAVLQDAAVMLYALTGWIPQLTRAPVSASHWSTLTSITQLNASTPADVKRAYMIACETTRIREARRQVLLHLHGSWCCRMCC